MTLLHVEARGVGAPVVLLHGSPTTPAHLRPLAARLSVRYRTLLVHLPGYGESAALEPYDLDASHGLVEDSLAAIGLSEAHFVGFSGGAYRAFAIATRTRLRVLSIAGLAAIAEVSREEGATLAGFAQMLRAGGVDPGPILEQRMLSPEGRMNPDWVADVISWGAAIAPPQLASELEAFASAPDLRVAVANLDVPILLRVGALDVASPPARSTLIAAVAKRAVLEEVAGAGHALLCEDFDATAASVERHLRAAE